MESEEGLGLFLPETPVAKAILSDVVSQRIPLTGTLELTRRCNFRCRHCYQQSSRSIPTKEIGTQQWFDIIDAVWANGCRFIKLTGGEALIRKDFPDIYQRAAHKGLLITVLTNGSLIDGTTLDLWSEIPPIAVSLTLYGASSETYERFSHAGAAYGRVIDNISALMSRGIRCKIKYVACRSNVVDLRAVYDFSRENGIDFTLYSDIASCEDGDTAPLAEALGLQDRLEISQWYYGQVKPRNWQLQDRAAWGEGSNGALLVLQLLA